MPANTSPTSRPLASSRPLSSSASSAVMDLTLEFVGRLTEIVENESLARARAALDSVGASGLVGAEPKKERKKPPRQICPVPGCNNTAAPIFGMVCSEHKDVPKSKIKKYREQRRAKAAKK